MNSIKRQRDMTPEELEFAIFCIENIALKLKLTGNEVYDILTGEDDLLDTYIIPEYDILHTRFCYRKNMPVSSAVLLN